MRVEQITFSRFIAAVAIVVFHYGRDVFPFNHASIAFLFEQANLGVSYFFILSGFVMLIAYGNKQRVAALSYYKNRFSRIYPAYLLAILLLLLHELRLQNNINVADLTLNLLAIQAWVPGKAMSFNYPGWSLTVEFFFYATFPFLTNWLYRKHDLKLLALPVLLVWVMSQVLLHGLALGFPAESEAAPIFQFIYYSPLMHFNEFLVGNVAGLLFINKLYSKTGNYDGLVIAVLLLVVAVLKAPAGLIYHNGLLAVLFIPLILLMALNSGRLTTLCNHKALVYLGEISFGIYILQVPVYAWCGSVLQKLQITDTTLSFYFSLGMLLIVSALSYRYIEKPLREGIRKLHLPKQTAYQVKQPM